MFKKILAIDIAPRISNFDERIKKFSKHSPIVVSTPPETAAFDLSDVDAILISIYQSLDENFFKTLSHLRFVGVLGTSLKLIPVDYLRKNDVHIANVTDYCDDETAEWVMMRIMEFFRKRPLPKSVREKKLGIIGVGFVGQKLIHFAHSFSMEIFYNAPSEHSELEKYGATFLSKEKIFLLCDVISFHTPAFLSWLDQDLLEHVKENSCLINTCMGRISVGDDLENFLRMRSDVTLIMDKIAGNYYQNLPRAQFCDEQAFNTVDVQERLVDKFFANMMHAPYRLPRA